MRIPKNPEAHFRGGVTYPSLPRLTQATQAEQKKQCRKECRGCKEWLPLSDYPPCARAYVEKDKDMQNGKHLYAQCAHGKQASQAEQKKQCRKCGQDKPLSAYPPTARASVEKYKRKYIGAHLCTQCSV